MNKSRATRMCLQNVHWATKILTCGQFLGCDKPNCWKVSLANSQKKC